MVVVYRFGDYGNGASVTNIGDLFNIFPRVFNLYIDQMIVIILSLE
jgi:hypothetical protein